MSLPQTMRLSDSFGSSAALCRDARAQQKEEFAPVLVQNHMIKKEKS